MEVISTSLKGLKLIKPRVFEDERGYFFESFNRNKFLEAGIIDEFVQDNQSLSHKGVLRGMHFQSPPYAQSKLVRVLQGSVLDVALDLRKNSPTYGQHFKVVLSAENKQTLYIPKGFAHGFLTLEDNTVFSYKCGEFYHPESEGAISWDDPTLDIDWDVENPIVSEKDKQAMAFTDFKSPF
jgi:dTDP-4-dehydrorhamnose 3,5-epimerase